MLRTRPQITILLLLALLAGCAPKSDRPPRVLEKLDPYLPEVVNYTPFPHTLNVAEDGGNYFFSGVMKATYTILPSGKLQFNQKQEPLHSAFRFHKSCPARPIQMNDMNPFKKQAEWYLIPGKTKFNPDASVEVEGRRLPIQGEGDCKGLSIKGSMVLTPYPELGAAITIHGISDSSEPRRLEFPQGAAPYQLVRYLAGQMVPAAAYPDTFVIDLSRNLLTVTYRATFANAPRIRKVDFRLVPVTEHEKASQTETVEQVRARNDATRKQLRRCPPTGEVPDLCVHPDATVDPAVFGG